MDPEIILPSSEGIVEYKTNIEGWVGKDGRFYGKGDEAERLARYANSTHSQCKCGEITRKGWLKCEKCRNIDSDEKFLKLEAVEWDGESMMVTYDSDTFFSDMSEVFDYCEDNDEDFSTIKLIHCSKQVSIAEVNLDEINEEYSTEDQTLSDFHPELAAKVEELNKMIRETEPKLWFATNKRIMNQ